MQLTNQSYWDRKWKTAVSLTSARRSSATNRIAASVKRLVRSLDQDFAEASMMDTYRRLSLPRGASVLEIGSAPGLHLIRLHRLFGLDPFGIDYSHVGAEWNKQVFRDAGLDPAHVIEADVFSPAFLDAHAGSFDVVVSRGFIEHFEDPAPAIAAHGRLAKPGGYVWINIPNYRWVNYLLKRTFSPENLKAHNLGIMRLRKFASLFARPELEPVICGYYGTCNLGMSVPTRQWTRPLYEVCDKLQLLLNGGLRHVTGYPGPNSRYVSPFLLFVGRKRQST
jgi:SAM-dependent methyltransferase